MWLHLCTVGYNKRLFRRLLGKIAWADRPSREASPHTSGPTMWMVWGPVNAKYTPLRVLQALVEAIATTMQPWTLSGQDMAEEIQWYVDAAVQGNTYMVGLWSDEIRGASAHFVSFVFGQVCAPWAYSMTNVKVG